MRSTECETTPVKIGRSGFSKPQTIAIRKGDHFANREVGKTVRFGVVTRVVAGGKRAKRRRRSNLLRAFLVLITSFTVSQ